MRSEFDKHNLMITAAVSAGYGTIDYAYNVPTMADTLDFINLMNYDYHGWWVSLFFTLATNINLNKLKLILL